MRQYISVDSGTKDTTEEIHMTNGENNQICGQIKSYNPETHQSEDVRNIFVSKQQISDVGDVPQYDTKDYTLDDVAETLHNLIAKLNGDSQG